jgi:hypothetical protein
MCARRWRHEPGEHPSGASCPRSAARRFRVFAARRVAGESQREQGRFGPTRGDGIRSFGVGRQPVSPAVATLWFPGGRALRGDAMSDLFASSSAVMSKCGLYRYRLDRRWGDGPTCGFIMLNPSKADADVDDPTIRRCIGFARREGCGALMVGNLFAFRATNPEVMADAEDPFGPENRHFLMNMVERVDGPLIAAWGSHWMADDAVSEWVRSAGGSRLLCLGRTKVGAPRHPLYVRADAPLMPFERVTA